MRESQAARREGGIIHYREGLYPYAPQAGSISAKALTRAYAGAARSLGAVISEHLQVTGFTTHAARVTGVQAEGGETIACNQVVIAAGSWSTTCTAWLGVAIPVHPAKGQFSRSDSLSSL